MNKEINLTTTVTGTAYQPEPLTYESLLKTFNKCWNDPDIAAQRRRNEFKKSMQLTVQPMRIQINEPD